MKICICSSLTFTDEVLEISKMLEASGHEVLLPNGITNRLVERAQILTQSRQRLIPIQTVCMPTKFVSVIWY